MDGRRRDSSRDPRQCQVCLVVLSGRPAALNENEIVDRERKVCVGNEFALTTASDKEWLQKDTRGGG